MSDIPRIRWLIALAAVLGLGIWLADNRFASRHGEGSEQVKQGKEIEKAGVETLVRLDTVYRTDTVRLTREVTKYRAFRDTLKITDTVMVKEFVRQADSTIHACLLVVQTCEQKDSTHKVIEAGLRQQNEGLRKMVPGRTAKIVTALKWGAIGFAIGTLRK